MQSGEALTLLAQLGSGQWGLVTTAQSEALGVSRVTLKRLQDRGAVQRVRQGVYALPSASYGPLQELQAAWLSTNAASVEERLDEQDGSVVSHLSAAHVHGLGDVIPTAHEFSLARRRQTSQADLRFHRTAVEGDDRVLVNGLPVTSVARTVEDLSGARLDFDHLATVVRDALANPGIKVSHLAPRLHQAARRFGVEQGDELIQMCLEQAGAPAVATNLFGSSLNLATLVPMPDFAGALASTTTPSFATFLPKVEVTPLANALSQLNVLSTMKSTEMAAALRPVLESFAATQQADLANALGPLFEAQARQAQQAMLAALTEAWSRGETADVAEEDGPHERA